MGLPELNRPFRGWKLTHFEGGLRVPLALRWPARIPAGSTRRDPAHHIDIVPTVMAAAGVRPEGQAPLDGVDLLAGPAAAEPAPRPMFWRDGPYRAVREGRWKLIAAHRPDKRWLFDLDADPHEAHNLAAAQPQTVARLQALMDRHHASMPRPAWPSFLEFPVSIDKTLDQPHAPGDEVTYWVN